MQQKTAKSILRYGECSCPQHGKHLCSWGRISQTIYIPSKIQKISPMKQMDVRHIWEIDSRTIIRDLWVQYTKVHVFTDSVSCNENPTLNSVWEWSRSTSKCRTLDNWRRTDGIRVEQFPRIHHIAARRRSPKVHEQNVQPTAIPRTNCLHVDVQRHPMEIWRQWNGMYCWRHTCVCICQKISSRTPIISDLDQKRNGVPPTTKDLKENGTESLNWWWSMPRIRSLEACSEAKWKIINSLQCRWRCDWNFFAQSFL